MMIPSATQASVTPSRARRRWSGVCSSSTSWISPAILPNSVCMPVSVTDEGAPAIGHDRPHVYHVEAVANGT